MEGFSIEVPPVPSQRLREAEDSPKLPTQLSGAQVLTIGRFRVYRV